MHPQLDRLFSILLPAPHRVGVVGSGSQAAQMRETLRTQLRLCLDENAGASSAEISLDREMYLLCATPADAARQTLITRGVKPENIVAWAEIKPLVLANPGRLIYENCGVRCLAADGSSLRFFGDNPRFDALTLAYEDALRELLFHPPNWTESERRRLEVMSSCYLAMRAHIARVEGLKLRRLLFPSAGRCGGVSITHTLRTHPRLRLRVDHEGNQELIYQLLNLHRQGFIQESPLVAILSLMMDDNECLGGNPFCFFLPYLDRVPWFECHVLKVERPLAEHRESIVLRNYHYTDAEFVRDRVTAATWGGLSEEQWKALPLESKVDWYILKVNEEIARGLPHCHRVIRTSLEELEPNLNRLLEGMSWPTVTGVQHLNTLPKDRVYSHEERIEMYRRMNPQ